MAFGKKQYQKILALGPVTSLAMGFAYVYSTRYGFTLTWEPLILKSKFKKKNEKVSCDTVLGRHEETFTHPKQGTNDKTKPSLMSQWMVLIGTTYTSRGEVLLTGAAMTQRSLHHWKPTPAWIMSHENWKLGAYWTNCKEPIILEHAIPE